MDDLFVGKECEYQLRHERGLFERETVRGARHNGELRPRECGDTVPQERV